MKKQEILSIYQKELEQIRAGGLWKGKIPSLPPREPAYAWKTDANW